MTRFHLVAAFIVACAFSPLASAIQAPPPIQADLTELAGRHEKLLHILTEFRDIEITFQQRMRHLIDTHGDIEVTNLYQGIDLSTIDGIHSVRLRVKAFQAANDEFSEAREEQWAAYALAVRNSDLAEPEASQLRDNLAADLTQTLPANRAWMSASRAEATAVTHLLDVAERHLGHTRWQDNHLVGTDKRASSDLQAAQQAVADADQRDAATGSSVRNSQNHVQEFVLSSLSELQKTIRRTLDQRTSPSE
jgi:hypothetical protein